MPPQASSHQIHEARFSSQNSSEVQKRGRALAPRDQNLGVRDRFFTFYISCI